MRIKSLVFAGIVALVSVVAYAEEDEPIEEPVGVTVVSSQKYVDDELAKKQPQFAGLGNDKLMLYSNTTDGATLSRDIVTTLGDSTSANTVPTVGAINTGLDTKQDTLNGTAGWVVENTGTAGSVKARPVYSTTNNYKTALVEAGDLNQIIIDAVNSELTVLPGIGWQINSSVTLPTLRTLLPDVNIQGTNYCYRRLNGNSGSNGTCREPTLATLGADGNKSGLWGVVFDYGDIVGKSVCSTIGGTSNQVATDVQESSLSTEFSAQSGVGLRALSDAQGYCWCKTESVGGVAAVSRWVFRYSHSSSPFCSDNCVYTCGHHVQDDFAFRSAMFNTIQ